LNFLAETTNRDTIIANHADSARPIAIESLARVAGVGDDVLGE
jgi:hypothetical protein